MGTSETGKGQWEVQAVGYKNSHGTGNIINNIVVSMYGDRRVRDSTKPPWPLTNPSTPLFPLSARRVAPWGGARWWVLNQAQLPGSFIPFSCL